MINEKFTCAREGCDEDGVKTTHNQKYCSPECCRIATNAKIMEKYHERAAIRRGKKRTCQECGLKLSRYNESKTCASCVVKGKDEMHDELQDLLASVTFQ